MSDRDPGADEVVVTTIESIAASSKYRDLAAETIERVVVRRSAATTADLAKRARRELHHVLAEYHVETLGAGEVDAVVDAVGAAAADDEIRAACASILDRHATSRERRPLLELGYYDRIFDVTGRPATIVDLAAALHPFEWRWMDLPPASTTYVAYDTNRRFAAAADRYLRAEGAGRAVHGDILVADIGDDVGAGRPVDLAFLLMTYHCLEDQHRGGGWQAVARSSARWTAVSLPVSGFGGRSRAKFAALADGLEARLADEGRHYRVQEWETERLYLIAAAERSRPGAP